MLTPLELDIMKAVWSGEPISVRTSVRTRASSCRATSDSGSTPKVRKPSRPPKKDSFEPSNLASRVISDYQKAREEAHKK